jgi:hypothetical protein
MKPPRYQDAPDEQNERVPYRVKRPERFTTAKQRGDDPGGPAYFRRPVNLGYANLKRKR